MSKRKLQSSVKGRRGVGNQPRRRVSFSEAVGLANRRAHEQANRRCGRRGEKFVWAAVAAEDYEAGEGEVEWLKRVWRWVMAVGLLPLCWVTSWTFLTRFSQAAVEEEFWRTAEFWYFATGALVMVGWFWSGLLQPFFLYLYVLGHELTHVVFVLLYRGRVSGFHVSTEGGYITTNKTNLVIALSPYFVPFWAVVAAVVYGLVRFFMELSSGWDGVLYGVMGVTWTFHMIWTLWMIPRDQPDLKDHGTFLSLVVIYLANLLVLVGLLCAAGGSPLESFRDFGAAWLRDAATMGDGAFRWLHGLVGEFREAGRF